VNPNHYNSRLRRSFGDNRTYLTKISHNHTHLPLPTLILFSELGINKNQVSKVIDSSHFKAMISAASTHKRKRKMTDLTKKPEDNSMQVSKDNRLR
jgi:hypothetical protein